MPARDAHTKLPDDRALVFKPATAFLQEVDLTVHAADDASCDAVLQM